MTVEKKNNTQKKYDFKISFWKKLSFPRWLCWSYQWMDRLPRADIKNYNVKKI